MVFRLIRQNKKATRWVYIIVTVFTMFTFSITGAVYAWFDSADSANGVAGTFVTTSGRTVEVSEQEFGFTQMKLARINNDAFKDDEQVWAFLMSDALAEDAGVRISDEMLSAQFRRIFDSQGIPAAQHAEAYRIWTQNTGLSASEFEAMIRRILRTQAYQSLFAEMPRVRSEDVFKKFQEDNEILTVDCVKFADADFATQIDKATLSDADLQAFLDKDLDFTRKNRDFSSPAELKLDVAVIDVASADVEKMRAALPEAQRTISDVEIQRVYDERKETKYKLPADATKPAEGEAAKPPEGDAAKPAEPEAPKYRTLEEVKAEIEKELLVVRVVNAANSDAQTRASAAAAKKAETSATSGATAPNAADPAAVAEENHLRAAATTFGLEYIEAKDAVKWTDLATWERFGSEQVKQNLEYAGKGATYPFPPNADSPRGFVIHVVDKVDPKPLPLAEIRERLIEPYVEFHASKRANEAATAFLDALRAAVRPKQQAEIDKIETAAKERAAKKATDGNVTDEAAKAKLVEDELKAVEPEIKTLLDQHRHEAFDEVVASQGLAVETIGPFRESYRQTRFHQLEPASLAKSVMGQFSILLLEQGKVSEALRDNDNKLHYVARVKEKRAPTYEEMGLGDRQRAENAVRSQNFQKQFEQYTRFEFDKLALLMNLQRPNAKPAPEPNENE